jgi:hypothetical protein
MFFFFFSQTAMATTRANTEVFLLGHPTEQFGGSKLPSNREVLWVFFRLHDQEKQTIREAATESVRQVQAIWVGKARIPVKPEQHSVKKLEALFQTWKDLKRLRNRKTPAQVCKQEAFVGALDDLFDIAHADALKKMIIKEDRDFLLAQREKGRRGTMGRQDTVLTKKEERAERKRLEEKKRKSRSRMECEASTSKAVLASSSSSSASETTDDADEVVQGAVGGSLPKRARGSQNVVTPALAAALDRTQVSDRKATMMITETARSLGHDPAGFNINRASIRRERMKARTLFQINLQEKFKANNNIPLTVHWDGKLLVDLTSKQQVDRLAILVSGQGVSQLLGVPKIPSGTGEAQAQAVVDALDQWGITDKIAALSFDTTASNTGIRGGACVLIEQKIGRDLLHFGCRHHVMEIVLAASFQASMGVSSGPDVLLFKRFQAGWEFIDRGTYESGMTDDVVRPRISAESERIIEFATSQLAAHQPRDDYRELLELAILFLGAVPPRGVLFRAPGPMHHARWMSKAIYSLKVWVFRRQFKMTAKEEKGLREMCCFVVLVYLESWFTAPSAVQAPRRDLNLMKALLNYSTTNSAISTATSEKLQRHLWYLSEELVGLTLFDEDVSLAMKRRMLESMKRQVDDEDEEPLKRCSRGLATLAVSQLDSFASPKTVRLFEKLHLATDFLEADPSSWGTNRAFRAAQDQLKTLKVVNDHAERGLALIQKFNRALTKNEEQLQFLLQVVADHRHTFPDARKAVLARTQRQ